MTLNKDQAMWLEVKKEFFSMELNGYDHPPIGPYLTTLPFINRNGKMLDMGCGNGMLLKFLMEFSGKNLEPFGIDKNKKAIIQAQNEILQDYVENFGVSDINSFDFENGPFDIIITNPFHAYPNHSHHIKMCIGNLAEKGRLILRIHDADLAKFNIKKIEDVPEFIQFGIRITYGIDIMFGIFDNE